MQIFWPSSLLALLSLGIIAAATKTENEDNSYYGKGVNACKILYRCGVEQASEIVGTFKKSGMKACCESVIIKACDGASNVCPGAFKNVVKDGLSKLADKFGMEGLKKRVGDNAATNPADRPSPTPSSGSSTQASSSESSTPTPSLESSSTDIYDLDDSAVSVTGLSFGALLLSFFISFA